MLIYLQNKINYIKLEQISIDGIFRIYNLDYLKKISNSNSNNTQIILINLYQKLGPEFFKHIEGEFALILTDNIKNIQLVAKDPTGGIPIFYNPSLLHISHTLKEIIDSSIKKPKLNQTFLYNEILRINHGNHTAYNDILILLSFEYLFYKNNKLKLLTYSDIIHSVFYSKNKNEYFKHFDELLTNSVTKQIDKTSAISLSSGLDSMAIAIKLKENSNKTINTYTAIPKYNINVKNRNANEQKLILDFVKNENQFNPTFLDSNDSNFISSLKLSLDIHPEPMPWAINFYWINDILKKAKADKVKILFNGAGGNLTISKSNPSYKNKTLKGYIHNSLNLINNSNKQKNEKLRQNVFSNSFLNSTTQDKLKKYYYNLENTKSLPKETNINFQYLFRSYSFYKYYDIERALPALDINILRFFNQLPDIFFDDKMPKRPFIQIPMQDKLPNSILFYKKRGIQSADYIKRIEDEELALNKIIQESKKNELVNIFFNKNELEKIKYKPRFILFLLFLLKNKEHGVD